MARRRPGRARPGPGRSRERAIRTRIAAVPCRVRPTLQSPFVVPQEPHSPAPGTSRPPRLQRAPARGVLRVIGLAVSLAVCLAASLAVVRAAEPTAAGPPAAEPASAAAVDALGQLLAAVGARPHSRASFVEHQFLKILQRPLESRGELVFAPPDRLEKRTLAPRPESLVVEGERLTLERGKRHMGVALSDYPQLAPLVEGIRATLAGDRATLERLFVVGFAPGAEWSLGLRPRDAQLARIVRELRIGGRGADVLRVETMRGDGDRSVMDITPLDPQ